MATYCGECSVWIGSDDVDKYGRRWCAFSRKYEKSNQESTGCRGFSYSGRAVLTEVCRALQLQSEEWFESFDRLKESFIVKSHMDWLPSYSLIGPLIAKAMKQDEHEKDTANVMLQTYLLPAKVFESNGNFEGATSKYHEMLYTLCSRYDIDLISDCPRTIIASTNKEI